jgi:hypothetical protein
MADNSEGLHSLFEAIKKQDDFLAFLDALSEDFTERRNEWESVQIDTFLEAISAFCRDYSSKNPKFFERFPWKEVALLFLAGKSYE